MAKRKKHGGHYCWVCQRYLPNEKFSGRGHGRHVCKKCHRLGAEELAYRQTVRNIDRFLERGAGRIRRKDRKAFQRFLDDPSERVRQYALSLAHWLKPRPNEPDMDLFEEEGLLLWDPDHDPSDIPDF